MNLDALFNDTGAPSATETAAAASPLIRGLERGLEETAPPAPVLQQPSAADPYVTYFNDPVGFTRDVLRLTVWDAMERIMLGVRDHTKTAVRSGHKVSKSTTAASIALWRAVARPGSRTVLTAPTARQVKAIIWKELKRRHAQAGLPGMPFDDPGTGYRVGDSEVFGFSTSDAEKMAGISGEDLLFIIDEASGVAEAIFEAIEGNMAGGARILLISNPTQTSGTFYEAFSSKRQFWHTIHVSSEDTPNARSGQILIPGLATAAWVEEKRADWGEDSPLYQVRVRGNFPTQATNAVIGLGLVEAARARHDAETDPPTGRFSVGVDVGRFGDDPTIIQPVYGDRPVPATVKRKQDNVEAAGHVMDVVQAERERSGYTGPVLVKVDDLGVGGGVTDHLKHSKRARQLGIVVVPVKVSERATSEGYSKLRDQLWFALRDWLKEGGRLPPAPLLEAELIAPLYSFDTQGRAKVESKDDLKPRLKRSPDRADALALAIYTPPGEEKPTATGALAAALAAARAAAQSAERAATGTTSGALAARKAALTRRR